MNRDTAELRYTMLPKNISRTADAEVEMATMLEWSDGTSADIRRIAALTKINAKLQTSSGVCPSEGHSGHPKMVLY